MSFDHQEMTGCACKSTVYLAIYYYDRFTCTTKWYTLQRRMEIVIFLVTFKNIFRNAMPIKYIKILRNTKI